MTSKTATESAPLLPFLLANWPEVKRTKVKQWLRFDAIKVNGRAITQHDHILQPGDVVSIQPQKAPPPITPLPAGLSVIHEDDELLVIRKPVNLLTIATDTERDKTAFRIMTDYLRESTHGSKDRLWIVHRLDRETSGLLVLAKSEDAKTYLQENWHRMEKRYQAMVEGTMPAAAGKLVGYIDETQPHRVFVTDRASPTAREATTHYRVLGTGYGRSHLEITLETGRRHQIRVQLAAAGCPIVGDEKYGAKSNPIKRVALHASDLKILHPRDERELTFHLPLPQDMARLVPAG
ncbi:23S rRNA pseudouridine1911/1915/1917 synthase [Prosthecobacter fusiformis]|uniref:Pseudouridine synthase n=1 Tax=Prosthecobacter fusiformis TaxID=48464 RepID=A0A4R7RIN8_9BACT|nr:RluA family pseudouridine synthase [Prosthecobacter fusiformis]TDU63168.1 23S rRNA pseudouridine1911/1915/1917 synthase [Prosthecobacter fusiformis]